MGIIIIHRISLKKILNYFNSIPIRYTRKVDFSSQDNSGREENNVNGTTHHSNGTEYL
jgi:hypothetical protein